MAGLGFGGDRRPYGPHRAVLERPPIGGSVPVSVGDHQGAQALEKVSMIREDGLQGFFRWQLGQAMISLDWVVFFSVLPFTLTRFKVATPNGGYLRRLHLNASWCRSAHLRKFNTDERKSP